MYLRVDDSEAKKEYVDIPLSLRMPCDEGSLPQVITVEDEEETAVESGGQGENLGDVEDVDTQKGRF